MKILIFLHGTIIMHKAGAFVSREERIRQVEQNEKTLNDFTSYIPIGNAVEKLRNWESRGAEIIYLSSHQNKTDIEKDKIVLTNYQFPDGDILWRENGREYKDIAEEIIPDILIEDDCESIGGVKEMTITFVRPEIKERIKSISVPEFGGIDYLPDDL